MSDQNKQPDFKELLDNHYEWPCEYMFKFIVKVEHVTTIENFFDRSTDRITRKPSRNGKYLSLTIYREMNSSDEVINVYKEVESIEGIIKL